MSADYISESEALADWEDDNCIVDEDEFYDNDFSFTFQRSKPIYVGRKKGLSDNIESKRSSNLEAKVGSECACPMCGRKFIKKSYQQKFCSGKCRLRYNNKRKIYVY